jgi:flagellar basal body-associated protein FliL
VADKEGNQAADAIIGSSKSRAKTPGGSGGIIWLLVLVAVVALCAGGGFYIGQAIKSAQASEPHEAGAAGAPGAAATPAATGASGDYQYLDIEPITINLDEPRLARYVRATITLAFDAKNDSEVRAQAAKRMPELKNWLAVYLAGRTLDEVRGAQSLNRVRREICDAFNEQIWPQQPPRIHHVLLKEFAVQ